ncbi:unnamed protein product [Triticum turgidum subsp. durum]|uniref:Uncharacterized protein n=1 Tax=Triticum turgidum subsp. durum TaxID=4567 RepID=A0A9R0RNX7_TRITD|nr:unnamed protein product [Triticum turgidum subsp. durum]
MPPKVSAVAAGEAHTLALTSNGELYSWGRGTFGRLGTGREADVHVPTAVVPAVAAAPAAGRQRPRFTAVAAGAYHSLALDGSCSMPLSRPLLLLLYSSSW